MVCMHLGQETAEFQGSPDARRYAQQNIVMYKQSRNSVIRGRASPVFAFGLFVQERSTYEFGWERPRPLTDGKFTKLSRLTGVLRHCIQPMKASFSIWVDVDNSIAFTENNEDRKELATHCMYASYICTPKHIKTNITWYRLPHSQPGQGCHVVEETG